EVDRASVRRELRIVVVGRVAREWARRRGSVGAGDPDLWVGVARGNRGESDGGRVSRQDRRPCRPDTVDDPTLTLCSSDRATLRARGEQHDGGGQEQSRSNCSLWVFRATEDPEYGHCLSV